MLLVPSRRLALQGSTHVYIAFSGFAGQAFARWLVIAWTHAGPRREMGISGEAVHIGATC